MEIKFLENCFKNNFIFQYKRWLFIFVDYILRLFFTFPFSDSFYDSFTYLYSDSFFIDLFKPVYSVSSLVIFMRIRLVFKTARVHFKYLFLLLRFLFILWRFLIKANHLQFVFFIRLLLFHRVWNLYLISNGSLMRFSLTWIWICFSTRR